MSIKLALLGVVMLLLFGCIQQTTEGKISVEELREMLKEKDFVLVNVHIPYQGEIPGTDYNIPYNDIDRFEELFQKDQKIVIYCRSGAMSAQAYNELKKRGFTNVYDVEGGMNAWRAIGEELVYKE